MAVKGKIETPLDMGTLRDVLTELFTVKEKQ
jgi:hypothetical protein